MILILFIILKLLKSRGYDAILNNMIYGSQYFRGYSTPHITLFFSLLCWTINIIILFQLLGLVCYHASFSLTTNIQKAFNVISFFLPPWGFRSYCFPLHCPLGEQNHIHYVLCISIHKHQNLDHNVRGICRDQCCTHPNDDEWIINQEIHFDLFLSVQFSKIKHTLKNEMFKVRPPPKWWKTIYINFYDIFRYIIRSVKFTSSGNLYLIAPDLVKFLKFLQVSKGSGYSRNFLCVK